MHRRAFLSTAGAAGLATLLPAAGCATAAARHAAGRVARRAPEPVKPPRLRPGMRVGLANPSGVVYQEDRIRVVEERLAALGLEAVRGDHLLDRHGYLAGTDEDRADDLNRMFRDDAVDAVLCGRGGWGAARLLPMIDFDAVRANPKVFMGYSDITALLLGLHARTGLVTFHGPVGLSTFNEYTLPWVRELVFEGGTPVFTNPEDTDDDVLARVEDRVVTIRAGTARGRLLGGNLTVLTAIIGSGYLPDFTGSILFLEDVDEAPYRVDRMLTQLALAGILDSVAGVVFGKCTDCDPGEGYGSLTLDDVLDHHLGRLGVPAWHGAMIGHIDDKWTVPVGVEAEIDAEAGTVRLLESAVS